jgi:hypothetical protein
MLETMLAGPMGCALFEFKKTDADRWQIFSPVSPETYDQEHSYWFANCRSKRSHGTHRHTVFQLYQQSMGQDLADTAFAAVKKVFGRISDS